MSDSDNEIPELQSSDNSDDEQADMQDQQDQQDQQDPSELVEQPDETLAQKRQARRHNWETIDSWDSHSESDQFIRDEFLRIANEKMALGVFTHVKHLKSAPMDLSLWKLRDHLSTQEGHTKIIRYRKSK